jgi:outer membrane protein assembly factor BamB
VTVRWESRTGRPATGPVAVADRHVVVAGVDGRLRGLNRTDGRQAWSTEAGAGVTLGTQAETGTVYAVTAVGTLLAVDAATGEVQWRRKTGGRFATRPYAAGPRVYAGGRDSVLYAYELGGTHRRWRVWTDAEIVQPPVVVGATAVVAGTDGELYGVAEHGAIAWRHPAPGVGHPPAAAGDAVCAAVGDGSLTCVRATDGTRPVRIARPGSTLTVPAGGDGVVYAAAADGSIGAWDPGTGGLRWRYQPAVVTEAAAGLLPHGGQVVVAYPDGKLVGLDAATGKESWRHTGNGPLDAAPAADGGSLFVVGRTGTVHALTVPFTAAAPRPATTSAAPAETSAIPVKTGPARTVTPTRRRTAEPLRTRPATPSIRPSSRPGTAPTRPTFVPTTQPGPTPTAGEDDGGDQPGGG